MQLPWKRKALSVVPAENSATQTSPSNDELELLQNEINLLQIQISILEAAAREAGNQLGEVAQLSSQLKMEISEGSSTASATLDALELEQRTIERRHTGLELRIATLRAAIGPKERRSSELAQVRDHIRQDEILADLADKCERMTLEILGSWRNACAVGFDLMGLLDQAISGQPSLDTEHQRLALSLNLEVATKFLAASIEHVNGNWAFARTESFHGLIVRPGRPRSELQKLA